MAGSFSLDRTFDVFDQKKLRNRLFQILIFCFHEASLGLDLRRYACAMNMADSAFERVDVGLFKCGIDYDVVLYRGIIGEKHFPR